MFRRWKPASVRIVWVLYWVALFGVTHTPGDRLPRIHVSHLDKAVHFTGYLLLILLCGASARRSGARIRGAWYVRWLMICAVYAAADELTQPYFQRGADVLDWGADMVGVMIGLLIIYVDEIRGHGEVDAH